jgi:DNA-binding CsgD family transcriptional regulator
MVSAGRTRRRKKAPIVAPDAILGREEELAAIARFFDGDRSGPRALLIEGHAGIGKTTLWREGVKLAGTSGGLTLVSRPSEAETRLSFTVLGDLLVPAWEGAMPALPTGQRKALEAALMADGRAGSRPDARAVSLAVLGVLRAIASTTALTIAIDDVQWTDAPSARALAFALRRLSDEPVSVLAARRSAPGSTDPLGLGASFGGDADTLSVGPIAQGALGRLLRAQLARDFAPPLLRRIHEASGGNPFFALEIGRALDGQDPLLHPGEPLPVPADLRELLRRRLTALPRSARVVALLIASSAHPTTPLIDAVEEGSGLAEAEDAGIVQVRGAAIEFTHPLLASAIYESASARDRRDAHAALASVVKDPEERARHLALSVTGPSEEVAVALDEAAVQAEARGAPHVASELYQLAATVTPPEDTDRSWFRRHLSAGNLFAAGDVRGARERNESILESLEPGPARAQTLYAISYMSWNDVARAKALLERALEESVEDDVLKAQILADLAWAELDACDPTAALPWARSAVALAEVVNDPFALRNALTVLAMAESVLGRDSADLLARGISDDGGLAYGEVPTPKTCLGRVQMWEGALGSARDTLRAELERYIDQGHESASWEVRAQLSEVERRAGRWEDASAHALDAYEIVMDAGVDVLSNVAAVRSAVEAATGQVEEARADAATALSACDRTGDRWNEIRARSALGFLELSVGDAAAAHDCLAPAVEMTERMDWREPGVFPFVPDEVEALVALGDLDAADRLTDRLDEQGKSLGRAMALATAARCRGLISGARGELAEAEDHLQRALDEHARTQQPFEVARTLLVAGTVRRRMRQKTGARAFLDRALATFNDLGAPLWVEKAERELARIGGRAPAPTGLTPTEAQIAELVAGGRTNREVAEALFISIHTVEANLKRIYRKLDVRSRTELARMF